MNYTTVNIHVIVSITILIYRIGMPGYVWDTFAESVPMSTYLVAFVVSDFEHLSEGTFSVWARSDSLNQVSFLLLLGINIFYILPK